MRYTSWDFIASSTNAEYAPMVCDSNSSVIAQYVMPSHAVPSYSEPKKEYMYVCKACGSEWHDAEFHKGTCNNCGRGAYKNKTKVEMPVEDEPRDWPEDEPDEYELDYKLPPPPEPSGKSLWSRLFG